MISFQIILPLLVLALFYFSIGRPLDNLPISVVNHDNQNCQNFKDYFLPCPSAQNIIQQNWQELKNFSCVFVQNLNGPLSVNQELENTAAIQKVLNGQSLGWIEIPPDFSRNLPKLYTDRSGSNITSKNFIGVHIDNSNSIFR